MGKRKITIEDEEQIRELYATGNITRLELSKMYGVSARTIDRILKEGKPFKYTSYPHVSLEHLIELGFQFDNEGNTYYPGSKIPNSSQREPINLHTQTRTPKVARKGDWAHWSVNPDVVDWDWYQHNIDKKWELVDKYKYGCEKHNYRFRDSYTNEWVYENCWRKHYKWKATTKISNPNTLKESPNVPVQFYMEVVEK